MILWTDGSCLNPNNPYLKTAGYGVVYDPTRSHVRTISKPLLGVEQSAQRAEIRAVLAALCVENRPCIIRSDSSYVVNSFQKLLAGIPLPCDGEHIDLWRQIQCQLELRLHSAEIEWIKGHANAHHVAIGLSTDLDKACNDAADQAANDGARLHAVPLELQQLYNSHSKQMCQIAALFTEIAVARNNVAKQQKLLTYKPKEMPSENSAKDGFSQYCVHQNTNQKILPVLKKFPIYHRSLRFRFGELAWQALTWYMEQLRWPQSDSTLGVTWAELCLDFELATGVTLPRGASICAELFGGSRLLGRQATWTMETKPNQYNSLEHSVEKVIKQGKVRFQCIVCSRSGAWSDRHKFLRQTCAGYTESPVQAIRRIRLEQSARKCSSDKPLPPATLDEKYQVFADLVGSLARHKKCFHGEKTLTCRALCPLGLPKCAGLTRRPILLYQEQITSEMMHIAQVLPKKLLDLDRGSDSKLPPWGSHYSPYNIGLPRPIWRPPAPD